VNMPTISTVIQRISRQTQQTCKNETSESAHDSRFFATF
jgi:hypothetical protein